MKSITKLVVSFAVLAGLCLAQQTPVPQPSPASSYDGVYYAPNFGKWQVPVASSITGGVTTTFNAAFAVATTADGLSFSPFNAKQRITIGLGSTQDTVTISSVSSCNAGANALPGQPVVCAITLSGAPTNSHSAGEPIFSADNGIIEAISYASNTGGGQVYFVADCGVVTLSTGGVTTTSTCFVPNQFYNQGSASRVTTTITTSTSWAIGIVNNTSTFSTAQSTLTAGTTSYGVQGTPAVALVTGATAPDLTAVLITAGGGAAGAGAAHIKVWGYTSAPPAF